MRPSKDDYYLGIAKAVCQRSTCLRRKYGAVIVSNKKGFDAIVGTGYNGSGARGFYRRIGERRFAIDKRGDKELSSV